MSYTSPPSVMAAYADSTASFKSRALQIQLSKDHVNRLVGADIKNFNHLAFAVSAQPGQLDDAKFAEMLNVIEPRGATLGVQAALRQLAFESLTIAVAAIRQRVEHPGETPRKLPAQELDERLGKLRRSITGFTIAGDLEPAHTVVNMYAQMLEEGALRIFPLSKCVSRELELNSIKSDRHVFTLEGQELQMKNKQPDLTSDLGNELKVQNAFIRRGLALELAGLGTFDMHEKVTRDFMMHLTRAVPPGFKGPTIESVLRADKELWMRIADECRSDLRENETGQMPVDVAMEKFYQSPAVTFHLLPLPYASSAPANKRKAETSSQDHVAASSAPPPKKFTKKGKKGGGKGRGNLPTGLHGYTGMNKNKQRICYNYNLAHGCSNQTEQHGNTTKCQRGVHQCIKCYGAHGLQDCNN